MSTFGRRQLGMGLGAALLAAGFLGDFGRIARAGNPAVAKRIVFFFSPNGTVHQFWRPTGTETAFTFPAGSILEPLAAHQADIMVCDGIDFVGFDNHAPGMHGMLTANGTAAMATGGKSVDQVIAAKLGVQPLQFGVQTGAWGANDQTRMSYSAPGQYVDPEDDPVEAYKSIFAGASLSPADAQKLLARRKSILDTIGGDLADLRAKVGTAEKAKLDQHLDALRKTETGLTGSGTCANPAAPVSMDKYANTNFPAIGKAQMDLMITALACGLTKVASIQWAHTVSPHVFSWLGITQGHHDLSHMDDSNTAGVQTFVKAERWYAQQFAYLLDQLKTLPEPGGAGTMLDNTLVVWVKELGDSRLHDGKSVPFVLAGKAGGFLRPGRYMQFGGTSHQKLLVSLCQGMGIDIPAFGDPSVSTGPLAGLT